MTPTPAPPVNYTSKQDVARTASQIVDRLGRHGATSIMIDYVDGEPTAISFRIDTGIHGDRAFRLPCDTAAMAAHLERLRRAGKVERRYATGEQAKRTAWRVLQHWTDAQLAMVEAGQTKLAEVMLPHMLTPTGDTVWQRFVGSGLRELEAGQ